MNLSFSRAAIIGATGPTGRHLTTELRRRGVAVTAVSRSSEKLRRWFPEPEAERVAADALDADALRAAVSGCDLVVDSVGLPPEHMDRHAAIAEQVAAAATAEGARLLHVSSFWSFLPVRSLPVSEEHPREGGNSYARARRAAEDMMLAAGACVVHLPDFFGPGVHTSTLQGPLQEALAGKRMSWLGSPDTEREYAYVPDAMALVADLALRQEAYGRSWLIPGSGPLSGRQVAAIAGEHLGREVKLRAVPGWLARLAAQVTPGLRAFRPILGDYLQPIAYDTSRLRSLLGEVHPASYEQGIGATLTAMRNAEESSG